MAELIVIFGLLGGAWYVCTSAVSLLMFLVKEINLKFRYHKAEVRTLILRQAEITTYRSFGDIGFAYHCLNRVIQRYKLPENIVMIGVILNQRSRLIKLYFKRR